MGSAPDLLHKLRAEHSLRTDEYKLLLEAFSPGMMSLAAELAREAREPYYGHDIYIRGLIEIGNICKNDCLYCGIRRENAAVSRYRLSNEEILSCCEEGWNLGFRTFVLQGGEGVYKRGEIADLVREIKKRWPEAAVTLSLGEMSREEYEELYEAGGDRYLLRHETADKEHYMKLHPAEMSWENRMRCLRDLREIGFQTGCGFMVGSPYQSLWTLAKDLKFVEEFSPEMCGIGPFIPATGTPFEKEKAGSADLTVYLISLLRLIKPTLLLPATTALGSIEEGGRERGIEAGANVVMPNLSPFAMRAKYSIYDNKLAGGKEAAENLQTLRDGLHLIGYRVVSARGDAK